MTDLEFPSVQYFYHEQRRHGRARRTCAQRQFDSLRSRNFLAAIDETTLLVPISLVLFRSSFIVNAKAIIEKAHRVGARVILDVFQGTGTVPFDVRATRRRFCRWRRTQMALRRSRRGLSLRSRRLAAVIAPVIDRLASPSPSVPIRNRRD